jgi:hypothetical protein
MSDTRADAPPEVWTCDRSDHAHLMDSGDLSEVAVVRLSDFDAAYRGGRRDAIAAIRKVADEHIDDPCELYNEECCMGFILAALAEGEDCCHGWRGEPCEDCGNGRCACQNEPAPESAEPAAWKATEFELFKERLVQRHPQAREWWRCEDCGRTYEVIPDKHQNNFDSGYCHVVGWSRVIEVERVAPGEK